MGQHHKPRKLLLSPLERELLCCLADLDGEPEPVKHVFNWLYAPHRGAQAQFGWEFERALAALRRLGLVEVERFQGSSEDQVFATEAGIRAYHGAEQ